MTRKISWLSLPALLALWLALAPAAQANEPVRHKLPNGVTVITKQNHEAPVVAIQVLVRAGSAFENERERGITHLIEHMIFKGTPTRPAGQMARQIEALGGQINAYTSLDHTKYHVETASQNAAQALDILADAVVNAQFDPAELAREKEVVIEEIRMNQDDPDRRRFQALMAAAFGDHPYGRPVIGAEASVRAISRQDILDYRAKWYRGPGMVVVAVGDFQTEQLLPRIEKAFAAVPAQTQPEFSLPPANVKPGPRLVVLREDVRQAAVEAAWLIPGLPSAQVFPLDMAAAILGAGKTSRLYKELKHAEGLVDAVSCSAYTPEALGLLDIDASLAPELADKAWPRVLQLAGGLLAEPPRADELARAKVNLAAAFVRMRQTMSGQAGTLGYFELMRGGFERVQSYIDEFAAIDADQVAQAAREHLRPENLTLVLQLPEGAPAPDQAALSKLAQEAHAQALAVAPAQGSAAASAAQPEAGPRPDNASDGQARKETLPNGLTVIVKPAHELPLVEMVLAAPGGQAAETPQDAGSRQLWASCLTRGAAGRSFQELSAILEDMAAGMGGFSGKSSGGLTASFLAQDWRRGLELLAEVWLRPDFPAAEVARAKAEQAAALRAQMDEPVARAFNAFRPLLYGDHPYAMNPLGSTESLARLDRQALVAAHQAMRGPGGVVLTIVGDVDPEQTLAAVRELFGAAQGQARTPTPPAAPALAKARSRHIADPQAKQTQIIIGYIAPDATDPRRPAMELLEAILGGQGGRLFGDLRDKRSLAYSVQPFYGQAKQVGVFGFYMGVGPGKAKAAIAGLNEHIARLAASPPVAEEMDRAKAFLLGGWAIGLQTYQAQAMTMTADELLGLGYQDYLRTPERVRALAPGDVLRVAKDVFGPQRQALLTLGL